MGDEGRPARAAETRAAGGLSGEPGAPPGVPEAAPDGQAVAPGTAGGASGAPAPAVPTPERVPTSRAGQIWVGIIGGLVVLALLLVFIFQNLHSTRIHFFTASGSFPVALALLVAAIGGALIVLLVGSVRILQLRRSVRAAGKAKAVAASGTVAEASREG